ncbi:MAG: UvrD-helicase domain-containing protein, partial [Gammaproteobacteria bacterium]
MTGAPAASLNAAQRAAASFGAPGKDGRWDSGPLLVIAGAGTGKTTTLAHRVAHLCLNGVAPERILLLTFTRLAAREMVRRSERMVAAAMKSAGARACGTPGSIDWAGT